MANKVLKHQVLFRFKPETPGFAITQVEKAFTGLKDVIPGIVDFEWGINASTEGKSDGFTHGFVLTFADRKGVEDYLVHPAHKEFGKLVSTHVDKVFVFDFHPVL